MIPVSKEIIIGYLGIGKNGDVIFKGKSMSRDGDVFCYLNKGFDTKEKKYIPADFKDVVKKLVDSYERSLQMQLSNLFKNGKSSEGLNLQKEMGNLINEYARGIIDQKQVTVIVDGNVKAYFKSSIDAHVLHAKVESISLDGGNKRETFKTISNSIMKYKVPLSLETYIRDNNDNLKPMKLSDAISGNLEASRLYVSTKLNNISSLGDLKDFFNIEDNFFNYKRENNQSVTFNKKDDEGNIIEKDSNLSPMVNIYLRKKEVLNVFGGTFKLIDDIFQKQNSDSFVIPIDYGDGTRKLMTKETIASFKEDHLALSKVLKILLESSKDKFENIARWLGNISEDGIETCQKNDRLQLVVNNLKECSSYKSYKSCQEELYSTIESYGGLQKSNIDISCNLRVSKTTQKDTISYEIISKYRKGIQLNEEENRILSYFDEHTANALCLKVEDAKTSDDRFVNKFYGNVAMGIIKHVEAVMKTVLNGGYDNSSYSDIAKANIEKRISYSRDERGKVNIDSYKMNADGKSILDTTLGKVNGFYPINKNKDSESGFVDSLYKMSSNNSLENITTRTPQQLLVKGFGFPYYQEDKGNFPKSIQIDTDKLGIMPDFTTIEKNSDTIDETKEEITNVAMVSSHCENVTELKATDIQIDVNVEGINIQSINTLEGFEIEKENNEEKSNSTRHKEVFFASPA